MKLHPFIQTLPPSYLFPEIRRRKEAFCKQYPEAKILSLGIGDAALPLPAFVSRAMAKKALSLSKQETFTGYGEDQGSPSLRRLIASRYYNDRFTEDEIFIHDGAKGEIARFQSFFGPRVRLALQDPAYPVYLEGSLLQGAEQIDILPCTEKNHFFPKDLPPCDLLYLCSPNNPTGAAASYEALKSIVDQAKDAETLILYDAAYASYIRSKAPRSIFEVEGASETAIEIGSFSKSMGFTGVRLGWTVVPKTLGPLYSEWKRFFSMSFNGASSIAEEGGVAALSDNGIKAEKRLTSHYLACARAIRKAIEKKGYRVFGGIDAPYLWVEARKPSWEAFDDFLSRYGLLTVPGSGFGPSGEGFLRLSAFLTKETLKLVLERL